MTLRPIPMPERIDCAIITIRPDEFEAVRSRFAPRERCRGQFNYLIARVPRRGGGRDLVAITRSIHQGQNHAQHLANALIDDLKPTWILVVGIAGGVPSPDFTLGDVVLSKTIHELDLGAVLPDGRREYEKRGGDVHPEVAAVLAALTDEDVEDWASPKGMPRRPALSIDALEFTTNDAGWNDDIRTSLARHFPNRGKRKQPRWLDGVIATSNDLIKDPGIAKEWHTFVRQFIAIEMESGGVYQAARRRDGVYPVMAIRGISDIVGLKRDPDWTAYACSSAASFAHAFVRSGVALSRSLDPDEIQRETRTPEREGLLARVRPKSDKDKRKPWTLPPVGSDPFEFSLASEFLLESPDDAMICSRFFEFIATTSDSSGAVKPFSPYQLALQLESDDELTLDVRLCGDQGLGKSTFLAAMKTILERGLTRSTRSWRVVYVDASRFFGFDKMPEATQARLNDMEHQHIESGDTLLILVDRLSRRSLAESKSVCSAVIARILILSRVGAVIWSSSDGFEEELRGIVEQNEAFTRKTRTLVVNFEAVDQRRDGVAEYLKYLQWTWHRLRGQEAVLEQQNPTALHERLSDLSLSHHLDVQLASVVYAKLNDPHYAFARTITDFLHQYCAEELEALMKPEVVEVKKRLALAGELALRVVAQSFYSPREIPENFFVKAEERKSAVWRFVSEYGNVRDYLCALHLGATLRALSASKDLALKVVDGGSIAFDFPKTINAFLLGIFDTYTAKEKKAFSEGCRNALEVCSSHRRTALAKSFQTRNFIYFLLGRLPEGGGQPLGEALRVVQAQLLHKENYGDNATRIALRTERRTICVSLMRLNRAARSVEGERFLSTAIADPEEASVDRGYHRIYYGDRQAIKDEGPFQYIDQPGSAWSKSFDALRTRLDEDLGFRGASAVRFEEAMEQLETQHRMFTLVSFVQSRVGTNALSAEQLQYARALITSALRVESLLCRDLVDFFRMMHCDLERKSTGIWRFVLDLYRMKFEPRRGWLKRGIESLFTVGRVESVADHSYFARMLVELLLPERLPEEPSYSKEEVGRLVLFHDIGEAFTGDFIRYTSEDLRSRMRDMEERSMRYLRFKETYAGVYGTAGIFESWAKFSGTTASPADLNAAIAHDIDRLENILQLIIYRDLRPDIVTDEVYAPFVASLSQMKSQPVRQLYDSLEAWVRANRGRICEWSTDFRDRELLASEDAIVLPLALGGKPME